MGRSWFEVLPETQAEPREPFTWITMTSIAGQSATDIATRGRTSGSLKEERKP